MDAHDLLTQFNVNLEQLIQGRQDLYVKVVVIGLVQRKGYDEVADRMMRELRKALESEAFHEHSPAHTLSENRPTSQHLPDRHEEDCAHSNQAVVRNVNNSIQLQRTKQQAQQHAATFQSQDVTERSKSLEPVIAAWITKTKVQGRLVWRR